MLKTLPLTNRPEAATTPRVGRKLEWPEKFLASFAAGTLARIRDVAPGVDVRAFIREAVDREIKRRSRQKP
jgi:hypothetical protein